jgi:hypothetical protein
MLRNVMGLGLVLGLVLVLGANARAEELVLKDGTKIVGKMTAISGDKIEVETAYGKMQVNRTDILTITFAENGAAANPPDAAKKPELPQIDESLDGTQYLNKTGNFSLTLPAEWKINPAIRLSPDVLGALSSRDDMRYAMVIYEAYSGSAESYKGLVEIQAKHNLDGYEKLTETPLTVDGKTSVLMTYRGTSAAANNLPIQFLSAIIPSGGGYFRITTWCVEPLFKETQPAFEKIIRSFHVSGEAPHDLLAK